MNDLSLSASPSLEMLCSQYWLNWLEEQNLSIALTTYQTNRLFLIGLKPDNSLSTFERMFERAMGLYPTEDGLLLATRDRIWQLDDFLSSGKLHRGSYDRLYVPSIGYTTGDLNTHELALDGEGEIIFVNTKYSCLAKLKRNYSFEPIWQPSFISDLVAEDRCHLNGMAMVAGKPKYVTCCSRSDVVAGWRLRRDGGGVVIDVESNEIVASGLSMPHSPRWYRGKLWLNNSGTGEFGYINFDTGKFEPVVFCPGFVRGLAFHHNYAVVGMSKPRDRHFSGLPLDEKLTQKDAVARCGVMVIDLDTGKIAHWIELEGVVKELFDVVVLPGVRQPMALGFKTDEIERTIVFPDKETGTKALATCVGDRETGRQGDRDKGFSRMCGRLGDNVEAFDGKSSKDYFNLGRQQKKAGDLIGAIASFQKVIQLQPDNFAAYNNLGNLWQSQGETDKAIAAWQKAVLIKPDNAFIHNNLGQAWQLSAKLKLAIEAYKKAIAVKPDFTLAYLNLGRLLHQEGALKRAEQCYQKVLALEPNNSEAYFSYGNLLKNQQRLEEAIAAYRQAIKHKPNFVAAYLNLGGVLQMRGANEAAKQCYQKVLKLEPDNQIAISNLAVVLQAEGDLAKAQQAYETALKLNPEDTLSFYRLAHLRCKLCDWDGYEELKTELIDRTNKHIATADSIQLLPLTLNFFDLDLELHQAVASHYANNINNKVAPLKNKLNFVPRFSSPSHKIRLGYVSADFRSHPVGCMIQDLFQHHDRSRFEVYCYSLVNTGDEITDKIKAGCDLYREIALLSTEDAAQCIHNDQIDILIDLTGYTTYCRPEIFALQPAPIQCQYLGFPGTMGADFMQYIIADKQLVTADMATYFSEEAIYLPHALVSSTMAVSDRKMTREEFGLPADRFVFCCFNRPEKISPAVFSVWMDMLQQVPDAVLWLYGGDSDCAEANLIKAAKKAGIESERLIFTGKLPHDEYIARYRLADLFLDTFNYNAGATAIASWQVGLPILTLTGNSFTGRMGASIATAAGYPQFICQTEAEYQQQAIYWATHPEELKELRQQLKSDRSLLSLFDLKELVSNLESAYLQMQQSYEDGETGRRGVLKDTPIRVQAASHNEETGRLGDKDKGFSRMCGGQGEICYQIVEDLKVDAFEELDPLTYPSLKQRWQYQQLKGELVGILAKGGDRNVGLIIAESDRTTLQSKILSLFVLPQHRQQNIGTELMQRLTDYLRSLDCGQIKINYQATELTKLALEPILARQNWKLPKTTFTLVQTDINNIAQAPWLYKYPLPDSFTIFPWQELTTTELFQLAQRNDYPPSLSPLTKDPRLEPLNSLGLRYRGKLAGWCLTHRIDKDIIRYSTMYVEPRFQKLGRGISLVAEAIKRQINSNIPYCKWSIAADNHLMSRFNQRHLVPYSTLVSESKSTLREI